VRARLAGFLLAHASEAGGLVSGYTHEQIGNSIGALRQTVTQALGDMQNAGLVEVGHKKVRVVDRAGLQAVAQDAAPSAAGGA